MATLAELIAEKERRQSASAPTLDQLIAEKERRMQAQQQAQSTIPESILGATENVGIMARNVMAQPVAGLAGIAGTLLPGEQGQGQRFQEATQQFLGGSPSSEAGKRQMQAVGGAIQSTGIPEALGKGKEFIGGNVLEMTGSPLAATVAASAPEAILELLGFKGASKLIPKGTRLLDEFGVPTKTLDKALDKVGLDFDNLDPKSKALIPAKKGAFTPALKTDKVIKAELKAGARQDALAPLMLEGNKVVDDALAIEVSRQGFDDGLIQMAKTSSRDTQHGMRKILNTVKRLKKDSSLDMRPSDVAGKSLLKRIEYVRDSATDARGKLDKIAKGQLSGEPFDLSRIHSKVGEVFERLDIDNLNTSPQGMPIPDFKGSAISGDPSSKRAIKEMIRLVSEIKDPSALGAHKMKRQLDNLIDFKKKSAGGLGTDGRNALKDVRKEFNEILREISTDYADVNDVLHKSLTAIDEFESAVGPSIKVFGEGGSSALGTQMRALFSNRVKRIEMDNAFKKAEKVAIDLGGEFNDNYRDLAKFTTQIEEVLGTPGAETSLGGVVGSVIKKAGNQGIKQGFAGMAVDVVASKADKAMGINEFNAIQSLDELLKR